MRHIYNPHQTPADHFIDNIPFIMEGQVMSTADPDQMGRVKVWVPALDGENFNVDQLPWADYASPFMGFTVEYPGGQAAISNKSHAAYGFWAIPKIGATVLVFCLNGDPTSRCYFASTVRLHRNRSLPVGRNADFHGNVGPWGDAGDGSGKLNPIQPAYDNLREQFQDDLTASEAQTRGVYERQVAQAKDDKDGSEGYSSNPADPSYLDPQTYCLVTPGRHAIIMQDDPHWSRLRIKTAEGHQVIFDDANERIYVSTSKGRTWFEMDQDGHVNCYGAESLSFRAGKDINFFADGNINMEAGEGVNVKADNGDIRLTAQKKFQAKANDSIILSACGIFDIDSEKSLKITAAQSVDIFGGQDFNATGSSNLNLKAGSKFMAQGSTMGLNGGGTLNASAGKINLNSGDAGSAKTAEKASCAEVADGPAIVPAHEPWERPESATDRGPNWKR